MSAQPALFVESLTEALREVVRACGGSKVVGAKLWPEKAPDAAARLLQDCLNEQRSEKLSPDQVLLLTRMGRDRGCHAVIGYMASECGYAPPVPIEPEDERAQLQRMFIESVKAQNVITERMERLMGTPSVTSIGLAR